MVITDDFNSVSGDVKVRRGGKVVWSASTATGERNMSHTVGNMEHHHFKFELHRRPGDVPIHYFGADAFSFGADVRLEHGDVMEVHFEGFGRP